MKKLFNNVFFYLLCAIVIAVSCGWTFFWLFILIPVGLTFLR